MALGVSCTAEPGGGDTQHHLRSTAAWMLQASSTAGVPQTHFCPLTAPLAGYWGAQGANPLDVSNSWLSCEPCTLGCPWAQAFPGHSWCHCWLSVLFLPSVRAQLEAPTFALTQVSQRTFPVYLAMSWPLSHQPLHHPGGFKNCWHSHLGCPKYLLSAAAWAGAPGHTR